MTHLRLLSLTIVALIASCSMQAPPAAGGPLSPVTVDEKMLRSFVIRGKKPLFPEETRAAARTGVAVAFVQITNASRPESVTVLQAPDHYCSTQIIETLMQWEFDVNNPLRPGFPSRSFNGKLTFYYRHDGGDWYVLEPFEMS